jgi:hypothetical protein
MRFIQSGFVKSRLWEVHRFTGSATINVLVLTGLATFRVVGYPETDPPRFILFA